MTAQVNQTTPSFPASPARAIQVGLVSQAPLRAKSNNRFWLGINFQSLEPTQAKMYGSPFPKGVMVNFINPRGPAVSSGIRTGDIILKANGLLAPSVDDMEDVVRRARGGSVTLQIFRRGKRIQITAPTAPNPAMGMDRASMGMNGSSAGMNVVRRPFAPMPLADGFGRMADARAPVVDMDRMMADQRNRMIVEKTGLDPALLEMRLDEDLVMRMAKDRLIAIKLGIDPALMSGKGVRTTMVIRKILWRDLAGKLGIDPALLSAPGIGEEQFLQAVRNRILAESLGVAPGVASATGVTNEEIARIAVNGYLTARLGMTKWELNAIKAAPPSAQTARTATINPGPADGNGKTTDPDSAKNRRRMEHIVASLDLDPNLLYIPGMGEERLLRMAGDRYLAVRLGVKPAFLDMPDFDRERIINMAVNKRLAQKLGLPDRLVGQRQVTSGRILKMAENRILVGKLGLPPGLAGSPGVSRDRLLEISGARLLASALGAGPLVR